MKSGNHNFKEAQTTIQFLLGPIKIKDGLFMGDQYAAKDIQFIISNKVTHVINTVSKHIPNLYERFGIQYLSVHWTEQEENIFDKKNNSVNAIFEFVEQAMAEGESCLIHSLYGKSRACAVLVAYLMKKYRWSLAKTLQFVNSKKQGLQIRNNYMAQMQELEKRMKNQYKLTSSWNEINTEEDLVLANTFSNSKKIKVQASEKPNPKSKKKLEWAEKLIEKPTIQRDHFVYAGGSSNQKKYQQIKPLKSILKGQREPQEESETTIEDNKHNKIQPNAQKIMSATFNGSNVTVNNFLQSEKKAQIHEASSKIYNTRPFSSDYKERQKRQALNGKIQPSDSMSSTYKNPYERHLMGKMGNFRSQKKKDEQKNLMMIYDRPISAKVSDDKRRISKIPVHNPIADKLGFNFLPTSSKQKAIAGTSKEDSYKWK